MPASLIATCPLCGLRFTNRALLELHLREDHPRPQPPDDRPGALPAVASRSPSTRFPSRLHTCVTLPGYQGAMDAWCSCLVIA